MRYALGAALLGAFASCGGGGDVRRPWPAGRPASYVNPIPAENARAGDPGWQDGVGSHAIEAYTDRVSARAGDQVSVQVRSDAAHPARWALYRLGWYGGAGARKVAEGDAGTVGPQAPCPPEAGTGLVRCAWPTAFRMTIPGGVPSGYFGVKVIRDDGVATFAPVVVVDDRPADLVVESAEYTWQAYNAWGGESLYVDATGKLQMFATKVSFDRPYEGRTGLGAAVFHELPFARWAERWGYDVAYTTDAEVGLRGATYLLQAGAFVTVGHDEYWSGANRDAVEAARDAGMPLLFLGANFGYWKVRTESPGAGGLPRVLVCYKFTVFDPNADPVSGPDRTGLFRDPQIGRPENALVGAMYESWLLQRFPLVATDPSSFLFAGTGLGAGDAVPLVAGGEYDVFVRNGVEPDGARVVATLPVVDAMGVPGAGTTVHYRAASGALVFDAASIDWVRALDPSLEGWDPRVERMTANVFREALALPIPDGLGAQGAAGKKLFGPPQGPFARDVVTAASDLAFASGVAPLPDGSLAVALPREHRIVRVGKDGRVQPLAGDGNLSTNPAYDRVPAARARFYGPTSLLALPDGSLLVADTGNGCLRKIGTDPDHTVTTFAGAMGQSGFADGPAASARFKAPMGMALDPAGNVLVADSGNNRIRAVDRAGNVTSVAGSGQFDRDARGSSAGLMTPTAVAAAPDGRIFTVTSLDGRVKVIGTDPGRTVTTLAGGGPGGLDGTGDVARLGPQGGAVWAGDRLLVADPANFRIRAVVPGPDAARTQVSTFAGTGRPGAADGSGGEASFGLPLGLALTADGHVLVADAVNGSIRAIVR